MLITEVQSVPGNVRCALLLGYKELIETLTSAKGGQLGSVPSDDPDGPGRWYFEWNGYSYSCQFLPSRPIRGTRGQYNQTDQDDVSGPSRN